MRLDRFLSAHGFGSRKASKKVLKNNTIMVNGELIKDWTMNIKGTDVITVNGKVVPNTPYTTLMLNKPAGYM